MNDTAIVFDIQRNSMEDGPGIRTTVFLKGCCMRCQWCHNPESFETRPQTVTLPNGSARAYGTSMSVAEVLDVAIADRAFFDASGGGVTVSGGEPFLFPEFLERLLRGCHAEGIHTAVETNGFPPWRHYRPVVAHTDLFLFDYKATPSSRHAALTGVPLEPVRERLGQLLEAGSDVVLRCPIIPGVNDQDEHFRAIAAISNQYGLPVQLMAYHNTARDKWRALHLPYPLEGIPSMAEDAILEVRERILACGGSGELIWFP